MATQGQGKMSEADWELEARLEDERWEAGEASKKLNALFANRIFVQPDGLHLRITFGERVGDEGVFHTSVVVPNADALEFGRLILQMAEASIENQVEFYRQAIAEYDAQKAAQKAADGDG